MLSYCFKCRKNTESKNPKVARTNNGKLMFLSKCAVYDRKKSRFIKEQEASSSLSNLELKTGFRKNPLVGDIWFKDIK